MVRYINTYTRYLRSICVPIAAFFSLYGCHQEKDSTQSELLKFPKVEHIVDSKKELSIHTVVADGAKWNPGPPPEMSHDFVTSGIWLRISIDVPFDPKDEWCVQIKNPLLHHVRAFIKNKNGDYIEHVDGYLEPKSRLKELGFTDLLFPIKELASDAKFVYLYIDSAPPLTFPVRIAAKKFLEEEKREFYIHGVVFGILFMMPIFHLFIYIYLRDKLYLIYFFYVFFLATIMAAVEGLFSLVWPDGYWWAKERLFHTAGGLAFMFLALLTRQLLSTATTLPKMDKVLLFFSGLAIGVAALGLLGDRPILHMAAQFLATTIVLLCLGIAIASIRKNQAAIFFVFGFSFFLLGSVIFALQHSGVLAPNLITQHGVHFGAVFEEILFSLALAFRINLLNKGLQAETKKRLEIANELETQKMIAVHALKMKAVGEVASGIAHEINNPLAILKLRANNLRTFTHGLSIGHGEQKELQRYTGAINDTIDRIATIVRGLLKFSHSSAVNSRASVPVSSIIEDTFELCKEKFSKEGVSIEIKRPDQEMVVSCNPTEISQVLLNLLLNAHDAMIEDETQDPKATVDAEDAGGFVAISVENNGPPVPKNVQAKMMTPFFTTKGIGKGTGLGLSISKELAVKNGGDLLFDNESKYTRFVIQVPKEQDKT